MSKGLGGIGIPIAVLVYKKHLDTWEKGTHAGTFRGNQLSIAAAASALEFAKRHRIQEYVKKMGKEILENLKFLQKKTRFIGDVRGCGLMLGIEYVKDKKTKTPFPEIAAALRKRCFENGLLVEVGGHYGNVVRFLPPLVITDNITQNALEIFEKVNEMVEKEIDESII
jgi:diaminobutyrate-2-oxoglutarate transaminase